MLLKLALHLSHNLCLHLFQRLKPFRAFSANHLHKLVCLLRNLLHLICPELFPIAQRFSEAVKLLLHLGLRVDRELVSPALNENIRMLSLCQHLAHLGIRDLAGTSLAFLFEFL